jgi:hypothetical protein
MVGSAAALMTISSRLVSPFTRSAASRYLRCRLSSSVLKSVDAVGGLTGLEFRGSQGEVQPVHQHGGQVVSLSAK